MTTQQTEPAQPVDVATELGLAIRTAMWRRGVTGAQLASALGVGNSTVSGKLKGRVAITVPELMTIAGVLGVDAGDLLPRLDSNQQPSGYAFSQVRVSDTPEQSVSAPVVDLGAWRERLAS